MSKQQSPSEKDILAGCKHLLILLKNQKKLTFRRIHTGGVLRGFNHGAGQFSKNHDMSGFSDFLILLPNGKSLFTELKKKSGYLSPEQIAFKDDIEKFGHEYHVVRSVDELACLLKDHGVQIDGWRGAS